MAEGTQGTHEGRQRSRDGWPNVKAPEVHPGRKIRKARERLAKRIEEHEETLARKKTSKYAGGYRKPGSLKCR